MNNLDISKNSSLESFQSQQEDTNKNQSKKFRVKYFLVCVLLFIIIWIFILFNQKNKTQIVKFPERKKIHQPLYDNDVINYLKLPNGIKYMYIEEQNEIQQKEIVISFKRGLIQDPPNFQGLNKICIQAAMISSNLNKQNFFNDEFKQLSGNYEINFYVDCFTIKFKYYKVDEEKFWLLLVDALKNQSFKINTFTKLIKFQKEKLSSDDQIDSNFGYYRFLNLLNQQKTYSWDYYLNIKGLNPKWIVNECKQFMKNLSSTDMSVVIKSDIKQNKKKYLFIYNELMKIQPKNTMLFRYQLENIIDTKYLGKYLFISNPDKAQVQKTQIIIPTQLSYTSSFNPMNFFLYLFFNTDKFSFVNQFPDIKIEAQVRMKYNNFGLIIITFDVGYKEFEPVLKRFYEWIFKIYNVGQNSMFLQSVYNQTKLNFINSQYLCPDHKNDFEQNKTILYGIFLLNRDLEYFNEFYFGIKKFQSNVWKEFLNQFRLKNSVMFFLNPQFDIINKIKQQDDIKIDLTKKYELFNKDIKKIFSKQDKDIIFKNITELNIKYNIQTISESLLENYNEDYFRNHPYVEAKLEFQEFQLNLSKFYFLSNCQVPQIFHTKLNEDLNEVQVSNTFTYSQVNIEKIYQFIIQSQNEKQQQDMFDYENFKRCLYYEFQNDLKFFNMNTLIETTGVGIYYKTIRSTYEHKMIGMIEIRNFEMNKIYFQNFQDSYLNTKFIQDVYCQYFKDKVNKNYLEFIYRGNNFVCEWRNLNLLITVEGLIEDFDEWIHAIIQSLKQQSVDSYQVQKIIEVNEDRYYDKNVKINNFFESKKEFIYQQVDAQYSTAKYLADTSKKLMIQQVQQLIRNLMINSQFNVFLYGKITLQEAFKFAKIISLELVDKMEDFPIFYKRKLQHELQITQPSLIHRLSREEHNSSKDIYQTYIFLGILSNIDQIIFEIILSFMYSYFLQKLTDEFGKNTILNIENLKIHEASSIFIQIDVNYLPHLLEQKVDAYLKEFIQYFQKIPLLEIEKIRKSIINKSELTEKRLFEMKDKIYEFWNIDQINKNKTNIKAIQSSINKSRIIEFLNKTFKNKNIRRITNEFYSKKKWDPQYKKFYQNKYSNLDEQYYNLSEAEQQKYYIYKKFFNEINKLHEDSKYQLQFQKLLIFLIFFYLIK